MSFFKLFLIGFALGLAVFCALAAWGMFYVGIFAFNIPFYPW